MLNFTHYARQMQGLPGQKPLQTAAAKASDWTIACREVSKVTFAAATVVKIAEAFFGCLSSGVTVVIGVSAALFVASDQVSTYLEPAVKKMLEQLSYRQSSQIHPALLSREPDEKMAQLKKLVENNIQNKSDADILYRLLSNLVFNEIEALTYSSLGDKEGLHVRLTLKKPLSRVSEDKRGIIHLPKQLAFRLSPNEGLFFDEKDLAPHEDTSTSQIFRRQFSWKEVWIHDSKNPEDPKLNFSYDYKFGLFTPFIERVSFPHSVKANQYLYNSSLWS